MIKANGGDPYLAIKISDVYAWQIDFFDIKDGDSFKVLYNEAYIDDTTALSIASIEGAIFTHQGKEFVAIPFTQDSIFEYFDEEGNSLRKAFLKAPLDFFRITSRFTNARFHPILKRYRAHHGLITQHRPVHRYAASELVRLSPRDIKTAGAIPESET
mgnify:FL=1